MPRKSVIKYLPANTRARIDAFLVAQGRTVDEFTAFLTGELGIEIGRSAAGAYQRNFEKVAARMRESRVMTEALAKELGEASVQGRQGRVLVEMARRLVFDLMVRMQELEEQDKLALEPKDIAQLGKGLADLGRALRLDQDFETKIAKEAEKRAKEAAAEAATSAAKRAGLSEEVRRQIEEEILGLVR